MTFHDFKEEGFYIEKVGRDADNGKCPYLCNLQYEIIVIAKHFETELKVETE